MLAIEWLSGSYNVTKWIVWLVGSLAGVLLITNVLLIKQNRNFKRELGQEPPAWRPPVGVVIPPIEGIGLKGEEVRLDWGEDPRDTFLFVFSTHCGVCDMAWPAWHDLARSAETKSHRLAYVNLTPPLHQDYVKKMQVGDSLIVAELDPKSVASANIRLTPEVIRISSGGKIEQVWMGLTEGEELSTLKRALER